MRSCDLCLSYAPLKSWYINSAIHGTRKSLLRDYRQFVEDKVISPVIVCLGVYIRIMAPKMIDQLTCYLTVSCVPLCCYCAIVSFCFCFCTSREEMELF